MNNSLEDQKKIPRPYEIYFYFSDARAARVLRRKPEYIIFEEMVKLDKVEHPSDIIWANNVNNEKVRGWKKWCFSGCTTCMYFNLVISSLLVTGFSYWMARVPSDSECKSLATFYSGNQMQAKLTE